LIRSGDGFYKEKQSPFRTRFETGSNPDLPGDGPRNFPGGRRIDRPMPDPPPVIVRRPDPALAVPIVYDSPHSGRDYPDDFAPMVPVEDLYPYEDRLVDDLVADAPEAGIALIAAAFPRAYVDPNRAADDLDREVVGEGWSEPLRPSFYAERGLGLIFRVGLDGRPIYERPLDAADVARRIERYWRPYHAALEAELRAAQARWGAAWHVSWHSMRPVGDALAPDPGETRPDFVVSDRDGTSADPAFTERVAAALRGLGRSVALNRPFKGGYITELHGRPHEGRHSVQVEINRGLYLDMATLETTEGAGRLRRALAAVSAELAGWARERVSGS
jgi:N-formylglutamate deformylase